MVLENILLGILIVFWVLLSLGEALQIAFWQEQSINTGNATLWQVLARRVVAGSLAVILLTATGISIFFILVLTARSQVEFFSFYLNAGWREWQLLSVFTIQW